VAQPLPEVYPQPGHVLAFDGFSGLFWPLEGRKFVLNRRQCLMESGSGRADKALVRPAAGFCLQTLTGIGQASYPWDRPAAKRRKSDEGRAEFFSRLSENSDLAKPVNFVTKASRSPGRDRVCARRQYAHARQYAQSDRPE
jgi:hypothetical protein